MIKFLFFWLCWISLEAQAFCGAVSRRCSSCGAWASLGAERMLWAGGSVVVAHRLSCSTACGIFPNHGWSPCPLNWQSDTTREVHDQVFLKDTGLVTVSLKR